MRWQDTVGWLHSAEVNLQIAWTLRLNLCVTTARCHHRSLYVRFRLWTIPCLAHRELVFNFLQLFVPVKAQWGCFGSLHCLPAQPGEGTSGFCGTSWCDEHSAIWEQVRVSQYRYDVFDSATKPNTERCMRERYKMAHVSVSSSSTDFYFLGETHSAEWLIHHGALTKDYRLQQLCTQE